MNARAVRAIDPTQSVLFPADDRAPMDTVTLLATLADWAERGWVRRLDAAFARFIDETCAGTSAPVLLAIALTAQMEGRGHTCVAIDDMLADPDALLGWKPDAMTALKEVLAALPADPSRWHAALSSSDAVSSGTGASADDRPLVFVGGRLYLRRYWDYERRVAEQVRTRAGFVERVDEGATREWLARIFPDRSPAGDGDRPQASDSDRRAETGQHVVPAHGPDWQKIACAIALRGRFTLITGGPGTGKTYTAARVLASLYASAPDRTRFRIALAAPTGKAAARLKQSIAASLLGLHERIDDATFSSGLAAAIGAARTLHGLLGARPDTRRFRHDAAHPLELDVLVVDEASMVHLEMMAALLDALPAGARLVLLGDKDQLASVEAGAVLGELSVGADAARYTPETARYLEAVTGFSLPSSAGPMLAQRTVMLRESKRFNDAIGALALAVNAGDVRAADARLPAARDGPVCWVPAATPATVLELVQRGRAGAPGGYRGYLDAIRRRPPVLGAEPAALKAATEAWARQVLAAFDDFRVLCIVRDGEWGVAGLNRAIEQCLRDAGGLAGAAEWYEGRPVIVTRNDRALGVFNGDIGIALRPAPDQAGLRVYFADGDAMRSVSVSRLADVESAFAMTVHKSQGSEFAHTVLVLPAEAGPAASREALYTGITRARTALTLVAKNAAVLHSAIAQSARRSSGLHDRLQAPAG